MKGSYILPILLIILTLIVITKHYNNNMRWEHKMILIMIFIMIAYTAFTYMKLDDIVEKYSNSKKEGFLNKKNKNKFEDINDEDYDITEDNKNDTEKTINNDNTVDLIANNIFNNLSSSNLEKKINNSKNKKKSNSKVVNKSLNKEKYEDVPEPTINDKVNIGETNTVGPIKALFNPQIKIKSKDKKNLGYDWTSAINQLDNDNYTDYDSDYYNKDFWRSVPDYNKPSWMNNTDKNNGETNQKYLNNTSGNNNVPYNYGNGTGIYQSNEEVDTQNKNNKFPQNKIFYPGYSYTPPSNWDVPQLRPPVCYPNQLDTRKLPIGVMDYGTPVNALELNPEGVIAHTEDTVHLTNVGSILPKFEYKVLPYALP